MVAFTSKSACHLGLPRSLTGAVPRN
jgi:hypothetical protein